MKSDWAGDLETRISVTGFIIYLQGAPVCWRSKAQKGVTLSSSEAEYVAISEAVKEIKFIYYLLQGIGINVELPIIVKTDNIGAMFMAQNSSSGLRTRHVDTRYHYIRENVEDGIIKIEFVKSMENDSDIFTKNVTQEIYEKHVKNFLEDSTGEYNGWTFRYRKGIGIWNYPLRSVIPLFVYGYPLGILFIYSVRTAVRTALF